MAVDSKRYNFKRFHTDCSHRQRHQLICLLSTSQLGSSFDDSSSCNYLTESTSYIDTTRLARFQLTY